MFKSKKDSKQPKRPKGEGAAMMAQVKIRGMLFRSIMYCACRWAFKYLTSMNPAWVLRMTTTATLRQSWISWQTSRVASSRSEPSKTNANQVCCVTDRDELTATNSRYISMGLKRLSSFTSTPRVPEQTKRNLSIFRWRIWQTSSIET